MNCAEERKKCIVKDKGVYTYSKMEPQRREKQHNKCICCSVGSTTWVMCRHLTRNSKKIPKKENGENGENGGKTGVSESAAPKRQEIRPERKVVAKTENSDKRFVSTRWREFVEPPHARPPSLPPSPLLPRLEHIKHKTWEFFVS